MSYILLFLAILCGLALIFKFDTGSIEPLQVAGVGIVLLACAVVAPNTLPSRP